MKKVLFVVLDTGVGGVSSSLSCLYEKLKGDYSITVLSITKLSGAVISFSSVLKYADIWIDAFYSSFNKASLFKKPIIAYTKVLNSLLKRIDINYEECLARRVIRREEKDNTYDTVIAFGEGAATLVSSFSRCSNKIAWIHCDYGKHQFGNEYTLYSKFNTIVSVSYAAVKHFSEIYPALSTRCKYIYNLVNERFIRELSNMPIDDEGMKCEEFRIISIGRIDSVKRFSEIPRIAYSLKEKGCKFKWTVLGPVRDEEEYKRIIYGIDKYDVGDVVFLMGGRKNPYPYLKMSDLLVVLSSTEACPMVFNEARILNVPIVSADFESSFEFINDGENGFISPIDSLETPIHQMITDSETYERIKNRSKTSLINNEAIIDQIKEIL